MPRRRRKGGRRPYPKRRRGYSKKARYDHHTLRSPDEFSRIWTVSLDKAPYRGVKLARHKYPGTKAKAHIGIVRSTGRLATQSILIPKGMKP